MNRGFTLIELLVVIAIISILTSLGSVSWSNAQQKSRDSRRKSDLKAIQTALELYIGTTGHYPPYDPAGCADPECPGWCTQISTTNATWKAQVHDKLVPNYISKLPQDPTQAGTNLDYFYNKLSTGKYRLYSTLENTRDFEYIAGAQGALGTDGLMGCSGSNANYRYKVTNP